MAKAVLDEILEGGMDNYDKEEAVYKWLAESINLGSGGVIGRPGMSRSAFTPHDVLTSRSAVCVGYATTFRLFMNMLGMDCRIVHNDYHSWDLVKLQDGEWYHVDVYSDAHGILYGNFNMTDAICRDSHEWDESALLKASLDENDGSVSAFYKFKTPLSEEDMQAADFLVETLGAAIDSIPDADCYMRAFWFPDEGDGHILALFIERYDYSDEPDNPNQFDPESEVAQQILKAIAEAFGLDPEALGLYNGGENGADFPADEAIGGADGPVQVFTAENGGWAAIP